MADLDLRKVIGLMVVIVIALYLLSPLVSATISAQYANTASNVFTKGGAGTTKTCTLYAPIWNDTAQISVVAVITVNGTGTYVLTTNSSLSPYYTVTSLGSYSTNATIVVSALTAEKGYTITIAYHYAQSAGICAMLILIPMFDVFMILLVVILEIYELIKAITV